MLLAFLSSARVLKIRNVQWFAWICAFVKVIAVCSRAVAPQLLGDPWSSSCHDAEHNEQMQHICIQIIQYRRRTVRTRVLQFADDTWELAFVLARLVRKWAFRQDGRRQQARTDRVVLTGRGLGLLTWQILMEAWSIVKLWFDIHCLVLVIPDYARECRAYFAIGPKACARLENILRKHQLSGPGFGGHRAGRNLRSEGGQIGDVYIYNIFTVHILHAVHGHSSPLSFWSFSGDSVTVRFTSPEHDRYNVDASHCDWGWHIRTHPASCATCFNL